LGFTWRDVPILSGWMSNKSPHPTNPCIPFAGCPNAGSHPNYRVSNLRQFALKAALLIGEKPQSANWDTQKFTTQFRSGTIWDTQKLSHPSDPDWQRLGFTWRDVPILSAWMSNKSPPFGSRFPTNLQQIPASQFQSFPILDPVPISGCPNAGSHPNYRVSQSAGSIWNDLGHPKIQPPFEPRSATVGVPSQCSTLQMAGCPIESFPNPSSQLWFPPLGRL
jgi:hypothetical protein